MKLSQVITRSSLAAVALLNLSIATSAIAEPIVVTRGPNGAAHVVKSDNIPIDAKTHPMTEAHEFPKVTQKGPGGASHIVSQKKATPTTKAETTSPRLVRHGSHGGFILSSK